MLPHAALPPAAPAAQSVSSEAPTLQLPVDDCTPFPVTLKPLVLAQRAMASQAEHFILVCTQSTQPAPEAPPVAPGPIGIGPKDGGHIDPENSCVHDEGWVCRKPAEEHAAAAMDGSKRGHRACPSFNES